MLSICATLDAFPSESEVKAKLRLGLTPDEVAAALGEPSNGRSSRDCVDCAFTYIAPVATLTRQSEGYAGVAIEFRGGRVASWRLYTNNPSYEEPHAPAAFKWWVWILGSVLVLGVIGKLLVRITPVAAVVANDVRAAFDSRHLEADKLPVEFRFITHQATLEEVIRRAGTPSRVVKVPISAESGLGYALVSSETGPPLIKIYEYDLPYHAAVIIIPEFPFEPQSRIRAVFFRQIQPDLAATTD